MTKPTQKQKQTNDLVNQLLTISIVALFLPFLLLCGFGLYALIHYGFGVYFALISLIVLMVILTSKWLLTKWSKKEKSENDQAHFVKPSFDWSNSEHRIWKDATLSIENKLNKNADWSALKNHALETAFEIAKAFGKTELAFTLLESLQLVEEISRRYRKVLMENVPAADRIKLSQIKAVYEINKKYGQMGKWGMRAWRIARLSSPLTAITSEIRGMMFDYFSQNLQRNAKRALLQEVAKTCIDLYSGRFKIKKTQIKASQISQQDKKNKAPPLEPVRVAIVGQRSVGKSSLVNALTKSVNAQVDILPSSLDVCVYSFSVDGEEQLHLIDMQGLDGNEKTTTAVCVQIIQSDLVLWVLKANQSSRELDVNLQKQIDEFYSRKENISRKKPKIIGVLNQIDKLKPIDDWQPPYNLASDTVKVKSIQAAIDFNRRQLALDEIYPLALPEAKPHFGIEALQKEIQKQCCHAKQVQLNRQRHEIKKNINLSKQGKRLFNAGKTVAKNIF